MGQENLKKHWKIEVSLNIVFCLQREWHLSLKRTSCPLLSLNPLLKNLFQTTDYTLQLQDESLAKIKIKQIFERLKRRTIFPAKNDVNKDTATMKSLAQYH